MNKKRRGRAAKQLVRARKALLAAKTLMEKGLLER
jgi:hypothetical protein